VLALYCSPAPSPTPQQYWTLNVSIDDPYDGQVGYIITDNYGNNLQAARNLTVQFANYPSNVSSVTLNAQIQFAPSGWQCIVLPSTVNVGAPPSGTGTVTQNFTVQCAQTLGATTPSPSAQTYVTSLGTIVTIAPIPPEMSSEIAKKLKQKEIEIGTIAGGIGLAALGIGLYFALRRRKKKP
jgi:hypothetical protein